MANITHYRHVQPQTCHDIANPFEQSGLRVCRSISWRISMAAPALPSLFQNTDGDFRTASGNRLPVRPRRRRHDARIRYRRSSVDNAPHRRRVVVRREGLASRQASATASSHTALEYVANKYSDHEKNKSLSMVMESAKPVLRSRFLAAMSTTYAPRMNSGGNRSGTRNSAHIRDLWWR